MKTKINELRKDKKFTLVVLVAMIFVLMLIGVKMVSAASTYIYHSQDGYLTDNNGNRMYNRNYLNGESHDAIARYPWVDSSGGVYYCVQPTTEIGSDAFPGTFQSLYSSVSKVSDQGIKAVADDEEIKLIMYYGYGYTGRTSPYWWRITQMMIWRALYPSGSFNFVSYYGSTTVITDYDDEIAAIQKDIDNHGVTPSFAEGTDFGELEYGKTYTYTDTNGVLSNFKVKSGSNYTASISGNTLTITVTGIGDISITLYRSYDKYNTNDYYVYQYTGNTSYQLVVSSADPSPTNAYVNATAVYTTSDVYAEKVDGDTGELVAGATICLYDSSMTELDCQTSSDSEAIYYGEYEKGTYYIQETKAPKGYAIDETVYTVTVDGYGTPVTVKVTDYKWSTFTLYKYDSNTLEPISSVKIALYDSDDVKLFEGWTDANGNISTEKILTGTYYYVELETVDGYVLDSTKHYFDITSDGGCYVYAELENTPTSITITKTDISTGESVPGATITIYQKQDDDTYTEYVSKVTDDDGQIVVEYLPYGDYYFVETEAPEGYILNDEKHYFTITAEDGIIADTLTNTKYATATIRKYNLSETTVVPGATIELYHVTEEDDELLWTCTTDANGECYYDLLVVGDYYYIETEAPEGYVKDTTKHEFSITEAGQELQMSFNNEKKSVVELTKVDASSGDLLQYATICVYTTDGELVGCVETDEDGIGTIELPIGSYYYVETIAPPDFEQDGYTYRYVIDDEYYYFDITEENSMLSFTVENDWAIVAVENTGLSSTEIYLSIIVVITGMTLLIVSTKVLKEQKEQVNNETTKTTSNDDVQPIVEDNQTINEVKVEEINNNENGNEDSSQVE